MDDGSDRWYRIDRIDGSFEVDGCVLCRWALLAEKTERLEIVSLE